MSSVVIYKNAGSNRTGVFLFAEINFRTIHAKIDDSPTLPNLSLDVSF